MELGVGRVGLWEELEVWRVDLGVGWNYCNKIKITNIKENKDNSNYKDRLAKRLNNNRSY